MKDNDEFKEERELFEKWFLSHHPKKNRHHLQRNYQGMYILTAAHNEFTAFVAGYSHK